MEELIKLDFLTQISYTRLLLDLVILFLCTKTINYAYLKFAHSNDNKLIFSTNLFSFVVSIFLIVSVIKTSIALSLGLVGALSIIRFRTAIKEPGQLITLLILTALSISVAAEKELLAIITTIVYTLNLFFNKKSSNKEKDFGSPKVLRVSIKAENLNVVDLINIQSLERVYSDVNKITHVEFHISSKGSEIDLILEKIKLQGNIISYEIL